jgi:hypothetical protein
MDVRWMLTVIEDNNKGFKRGSLQFWNCALKYKKCADQNEPWIASNESERLIRD